MAEQVSVIDIVTQVTDQTAPGVNSATQNVSKLEKVFQKVQGEINKLSKMGKIEIAMYAVDKASKGSAGDHPRRFAPLGQTAGSFGRRPQN